MQVLALFRVEDQEQAAAEQVFRHAIEGIGPLFDSAFVRWQDLLKFMLGWAYNRRPVNERASWQQAAEQVQSDERRKKEAKMQGITIADAIRMEGIVEGQAKGKLEAVLRQARRKWGEPDVATLQRIQAIHDDASLDRMIDAVFEAQSWVDLLNAI